MLDTEKCCHLINAMAEQESKQNAQKAVLNTSSYDLAVKHLQENYDRKKLSMIITIANKMLPTNHDLSGVAPYLNPEGLIRVGGRLGKAEISMQEGHPLILSTKSCIEAANFASSTWFTT